MFEEVVTQGELIAVPVKGVFFFLFSIFVRLAGTFFVFFLETYRVLISPQLLCNRGLKQPWSDEDPRHSFWG